MAIISEDSDLRETWLHTIFGGNGDYYIILKEYPNGRQSTIKSAQSIGFRACMSGGALWDKPEIKKAIADLHWALEKYGLNEHPDDSKKSNS